MDTAMNRGNMIVMAGLTAVMARGVHAVKRDDEQSRDDVTSQFEHLSFATMSLLPNERDNRYEVFAKLDIKLSNKD